MIRPNTFGQKPRIHRSAYIDPSAVIIGVVSIGKGVFGGPGAVIRADEPESAIRIGSECNIQDRVIVHALSGSTVNIREKVSLSHGCVVHGPCLIDKNTFIGFGSVVFNAVIGRNAFVKSLAVIENVKLPPGSLVKSKALIDSAAKLDELEMITAEQARFSDKVVKVNVNLAKGYKLLSV